jgi:hypothetical protein
MIKTLSIVFLLANISFAFAEDQSQIDKRSMTHAEWCEKYECDEVDNTEFDFKTSDREGNTYATDFFVAPVDYVDKLKKEAVLQTIQYKLGEFNALNNVNFSYCKNVDDKDSIELRKLVKNFNEDKYSLAAKKSSLLLEVWAKQERDENVVWSNQTYSRMLELIYSAGRAGYNTEKGINQFSLGYASVLIITRKNEMDCGLLQRAVNTKAEILSFSWRGGMPPYLYQHFLSYSLDLELVGELNKYIGQTQYYHSQKTDSAITDMVNGWEKELSYYAQIVEVK